MTQPASILLVAGARPNFPKIAPLIRALRRRPEPIRPVLVHTGQHYDYAMSQVFFEDLDLPPPDHHLEAGSGTHAAQTGQVLIRTEALLAERRPALVVVVGDVNSTLAAALAAAKLGVPVAHVEAGLRSFDRAMPEEVNRVLTDRLSTLLFVTEPAAVENLRREGFEDRCVHPCGNVMADELLRHRAQIGQRQAAARLGLSRRGYGLVTLHRPSNVDDAEALRRVLAVLGEAARRGPVVFPMHPRTRRRIEECGLSGDFSSLAGLRAIEPQGYLDFLSLLESAAWVMTDSGGLQVEAGCLEVPCLTLRTTTEHVLTIEEGRNRLIAMRPEAVAEGLDWAAAWRPDRPPPAVWDGAAAERIAAIIAANVV